MVEKRREKRLHKLVQDYLNAQDTARKSRVSTHFSLVPFYYYYLMVLLDSESSLKLRLYLILVKIQNIFFFGFKLQEI